MLDDPGVNAFAAPGGYVFVTKGLIDRVDEAELAGILTDEITHVTDKHHLQALGKKARAGVATQIVSSQLNSNLGGAVSAQLLALGRDIDSSGLNQDDEFDGQPARRLRRQAAGAAVAAAGQPPLMWPQAGASAATRKPQLLAALSGVLEPRAATR